jgi:O-antigen ligase
MPGDGNGRLERLAWALLWLFVFSIPWQKSAGAPGVGTLSHLFGVVAFAAGAAAAWRRGRVRPPNLAIVLAGAWVLWSAATYFWSLDPAATASRALTFFELWVMFWLVWDQCRSASRQSQLLLAYVLGAVAASGLGVLRYWQGRETYYRRYTAPGFDPNDFGLILALAIPMALYLSLRGGRRARGISRAAILAILPGLLLTGSRTALVAALVGFGFAVWTWRRAEGWERAASLLPLVLLLAGVFRLAPEHSRERLATLPSELAQGTLHNRTQIWKAGLKALKRHPLAGVGAGAYPEAVRPWLGVPPRAGHRYVAHNTFLSVLVEGGVTGFGLYALLLMTLVVYVLMMRPVERALWAVMLAAWAAGVSTLTWEQYSPSWLMAALITTEWARSFESPGEGA